LDGDQALASVYAAKTLLPPGRLLSRRQSWQTRQRRL